MANINEMHIKKLWDHTAECGHKRYNDGSENQHDILEKKPDERMYFLYSSIL